MKKHLLLTAIAGFAFASVPGVVSGQETTQDYTDGFFYLNEDLYGSNGSVNFFRPDATDGNNWEYRVFRTVNPGKYLGMTSQDGQVWGGKFYIMSKMLTSNEATAGALLTVADAKTMESEYQLESIAPAGTTADGRGFLGIDSHKAYISTSNGVWVLDLDNHSITGQIEGTGSTEPSNPYVQQSGKMVISDGKVFLAHQSKGLVVIDSETDKVIKTLSFEFVKDGAGIGSVVLAKDGSLWASVSVDTDGTASASGALAALPVLVNIDKETYSTEIINLPDDIQAPANSWGSWTPDAFCASAMTNVLYWNGATAYWAPSTQIYKFDVATKTASKFIDLSADGEGWSLYGCSMRPNPETDELYLTLNKNYGPDFKVNRYSAAGTLMKEYAMDSYYWYPSIPVFPQADGLSGVEEIRAGIMVSDVAVYVAGGQIVVENGEGETVEVYSLSGSLLYRGTSDAARFVIDREFADGVLIVKAGELASKVRI